MGASACVRDDLPDEAAVDLQAVDGEAVEAGQHRVAGAEVVDRDADAEVAEPLEHLGAPVLVDGETLGHLELEERGRQAAIAASTSRTVPISRSGDWKCRAERLTATRTGGRPVVRASRRPCWSAWRSTQVSTSTMRPDSSASGTNSFGPSSAEDGVLPAHERLDADDPARAHVDLGLVADPQLVAANRLVELALTGEPLVGELVHALGVDLVAAGPVVLGPVQRAVGVAQQVPGFDAVVGKKARPAHAVMNTSWPPSGMGRPTAASSFSVSTPADSAVPTPWQQQARTRRSTVGRRCRRAPPRAQSLARRSAAARRRTRGRGESLTLRKASRSRATTANVRARCARALADCLRSRGRRTAPGSGGRSEASWTAWWRELLGQPSVLESASCRRPRSAARSWSSSLDRAARARRASAHRRRLEAHADLAGPRAASTGPRRRSVASSVDAASTRASVDLCRLDRGVGGLGGPEQRFGSLPVALGSEVLRQHDDHRRQRRDGEQAARGPTPWRRARRRSRATPRTAPGRGRSAEPARQPATNGSPSMPQNSSADDDLPQERS